MGGMNFFSAMKELSSKDGRLWCESEGMLFLLVSVGGVIFYSAGDEPEDEVSMRLLYSDTVLEMAMTGRFYKTNPVKFDWKQI